jgi:hypothetical protein
MGTPVVPALRGLITDVDDAIELAIEEHSDVTNAAADVEDVELEVPRAQDLARPADLS